MVQSTNESSALPKGPTGSQGADAREKFERDGFFCAPPVLPPDLIRRVDRAMDEILVGKYETGIEALGNANPPGVNPTKLVKIDNAHRSNRTIMEALTHPLIGQWAAAITGAKKVQLFCSQLLVKPPSSAETANVGWHQDMEYWCTSMQGNLFTAWLAISDVPAELGPMKFVRGSNHWGLLKAGDFFSGAMDATKARMQAKFGSGTWEEVLGTLPPGGVSFHHNLTIHGSGANLGTKQRRGFAIHLMTETGGMLPGRSIKEFGHLNDFADEAACPVIFGK